MFQVSLTAQALANQISIKPNLIVEIEGVPLIFGIAPILEAARWDTDLNWDGDGLRWDGLVQKKESRDYISFKSTTKTIQQQVLIDKGGSSSVSTMNIQIVNKNIEISKAISFDNITEILGKRANVYLNYADGSHPEDSIPIFRGYIDDYSDDSTSVILSISHSENLKRKTFFDKFTANLISRVKYKEISIQDIYLTQRNKNKTNLSIEYVVDNGIAGYAQATYVSNVITVKIRNNVAGHPTATEILTEIRNSADVNAEVVGEVVGSGSAVQVAQALTFFDVDNVIYVDSTAGLIQAQDDFLTYLKIDDEIVRVISVDSINQITINRGELESFSDSHDDDSDVSSIYRLRGNPFDLSLKIMLSSEGNEFYESSQVIESFRYVDNVTDLPRGIIFSNIDIQDSTGLTENDIIEISGSDFNDGHRLVDSFGFLPDGRSVLYVKGEPLITETSSEPVFRFKSKYNVFPTGLGMQPSEVDVEGFESQYVLYAPNFTEYDFRIEDSIETTKDFIDTQIFYPQGLYSIPRKARSSVKYTSPPLSSEETPLLDINTVVDLHKVKQRRSTHKYFYNNIVFKFAKDVFDQKYKRGIVTIANDSFDRIKVGKTPFTIESDGLVRDTATDLMISRLSTRLLNRYKFGARFFPNVQVLYKVGYNLEIGDIILFGGENTQMIDLQTGTRDFPVAQYEIVNKSIAIETGVIKIDLLETGFGIDGRFGVISPSSTIKASSTKELLNLNKFLDIGEFNNEGLKWIKWIGCRVVVRNEDYTYCEEATILNIPDYDLDSMIITELPTLPPADSFVELAKYDSQPVSSIGNSLKLKYTFLMESQLVVTQINNNSFEGDVGGLVVGQKILVHSDDYAQDSIEVEIVDITGNIITVGDDLGFAPDVGYRIETLSFASDGGDGYRYL